MKYLMIYAVLRALVLGTMFFSTVRSWWAWTHPREGSTPESRFNAAARYKRNLVMFLVAFFIEMILHTF